MEIGRQFYGSEIQLSNLIPKANQNSILDANVKLLPLFLDMWAFSLFSSCIQKNSLEKGINFLKLLFKSPQITE